MIGPLGEEELAWIGDFDQAVLAHLEDPELIRGSEPVLGGAQDAIHVVAISFERHYRIHHVFQHLWSREVSFLGDVAYQEHRNAGVGWYIWELMITQRWGTVHGVFYTDGTVRDPAIPAAIMGFFRNRAGTVVLEDPDREGWVTRAVGNAKKWLQASDAKWEDGLRAAEVAANLLESAQLVAMREPPTRTLDLLRRGPPDMASLRAALERYVALLEPHQHAR